MIHNEIFVQFLIPEQISNVFLAVALSDDLKELDKFEMHENRTEHIFKQSIMLIIALVSLKLTF